METYDVLIIGIGTAGETAAGILRDAGKTVAMVDAGPVGGTCALRGCQPKKVFVVNTHLAADSRALVGRGMAQGAMTDWGELQRFKRTFTDPIPDGTRRSLEQSGVDVYVEHARFVGPKIVELADSGRRLEGTQILIANGARSRELPVPGAEHAATSDDFAALSGAKVTVLQRGPQVLPQFPASLVAPVVEAGEKHGITFVTGASVSGVEKTGSGYRVSTKEKGAFDAAWVMAAIGRAPNVEDLGLEDAGVDASRRGIEVNERMETSAPGVYAAGDCVATKQLSPISDLEARVAAANILEPGSASADYDLIPSVVFTHPQMASVGPTPEAARDAGREVTVRSGRTDEWAPSRRLGSPVGYYETVADAQTGRLLGAHLAGPHAGEQINVLTLAIRQGMTADQFRAVPWAYPTAVSDLEYTV